MVGVKKGWTSVSNPTRAALLQRFGEVVASLESMRASATVESVQGQIQDVLSDLQNLRSKLQTMPERKLAVVASLDHLASLADAVEALAASESDSSRAEWLAAAQNSILQISRQFS